MMDVGVLMSWFAAFFRVCQNFIFIDDVTQKSNGGLAKFAFLSVQGHFGSLDSVEYDL